MNIILPDGSVKELAEGATIADVAASIGAGLAKAALAGKIDSAPADLNAPVHDGATVEIITSKSAEALGIMRHSCAHVMAEAVQELFPGAQIAFGPATEDGFFYDFELSRSLTPDDFAAIEEKMAAIVKADEPFVREVVSRDRPRRSSPTSASSSSISTSFPPTRRSASTATAASSTCAAARICPPRARSARSRS